MNRFEIKPDPDFDFYFDLIICQNESEYGEWDTDNPKSASTFLPNSFELDDNINKLALLIFRQEALTPDCITYHSAMAGHLFGEVVAVLADCETSLEETQLAKVIAAQATVQIQAEIKKIAESNYPVTS